MHMADENQNRQPIGNSQTVNIDKTPSEGDEMGASANVFEKNELISDNK